MQPLVKQHEACRDYKIHARARGLSDDHIMLVCLMGAANLEAIAKELPLGPVLTELRAQYLGMLEDFSLETLV